MGNKCMIDVKSKKELDDLYKQYPFVVTMYRSDNCGHCREAHPVIEQRCKDIEGAVPVADCPVDSKKFCLNDMKKMGEEGIPLIVGVKDGDTKNPAFVIRGAQIENINHNFDILQQWKEEAMRASGRVPDTRPVDQQVMLAPRGNDDAIMSMLGLGAGHARQRSQPVTLCTPGHDCTMDDFNDSAVMFMLSSKGRRNGASLDPRRKST